MAVNDGKNEPFLVGASSVVSKQKEVLHNVHAKVEVTTLCRGRRKDVGERWFVSS